MQLQIIFNIHLLPIKYWRLVCGRIKFCVMYRSSVRARLLHVQADEARRRAYRNQGKACCKQQRGICNRNPPGVFLASLQSHVRYDALVPPRCHSLSKTLAVSSVESTHYIAQAGAALHCRHSSCSCNGSSTLSHAHKERAGGAVIRRNP